MARDEHLNLHEMQFRLSIWQEKNFGHVPHGPDQMFKGIVEELGELAHADLKREQQIRGTHDEHTAAMMDAIGDICIYLMQYATQHSIDFSTCLLVAYNEVISRDWVKYPKNGKTE